MRTFRKHDRVLAATLVAAAMTLGAMPISSPAQQTSGAYAATDSDVAARVKNALQSDSALDSRHIDVAVEHGDVVLKGFVQDNRALLTAQQVAKKAAGDRKIVSELTIKQNFPNAP